MTTYIKRGKSGTQQQAEDTKVAEIVAGIISDIQTNGDAAVKKYSEKFDHWTPESFRLTDRQIDDIVAYIVLAARQPLKPVGVKP